MIFPPIAALLGANTIPLAIAGIGFMGIRAWEIFCHGDRLFGITEQTQKFLGMTEATIYSGSRCNAVHLINPQHLRNWEN